MADIPAWAAQYIGIPFVAHGRDITGWDCWGLCRHVWREHYGIEVPSYDETYVTPNDVREISAVLGRELPDTPWRPIPIAQAQPGDGLLFLLKGSPTHIGILVAGDRFLHADPTVGTCIDRLSAAWWERRLVSAYRYMR